MTPRAEDDLKVTREAAAWFMELHTEGPARHAEFARWLRRSPEHIEEFLAISGISRRLDGLDAQHRIDVRDLLADDGAEIIRLAQVGEGRDAPAPPRPRIVRGISWLGAGLAAAACMLGAAFILIQWIGGKPEVYVTRVGEQRAFKLPDGSLIHLNTQSRAQLHFTDRVREIRLMEGEAMFVVERDAVRPFRVVSDGTTVQALGTQFNVYRLPSGKTTVSVMEGAVQVMTGSGSRQAASSGDPAANSGSGAAEATKALSLTRLDAGEQASIRNGLVEKSALPDPDSVTAWRQRRLVFRDKPLSDVVAEFNRYNTVQFEVEPAAGSEPLSGVFAADRPESLTLFLEKDKSVRVERDGERLVIRAMPADR